jgi:hypothetical protein
MPCSNDLFTAALIVAASSCNQKHLQTSSAADNIGIAMFNPVACG